jgi:ABC-type multidrug transport system fused ATPase/permease subunit
MIILGTVMAVAAGLALPGHIILFGDVINEFVFHELAETLQTQSMNATNVDNGTEFFCSRTDAGDSFSSNLGRYFANPDSTLLTETGLYSLYYVGLATGVLIATFLATVLWNISAYRQTRRMRMAFYHSILRQEIGWFDVSDANELSTRLAE